MRLPLAAVVLLSAALHAGSFSLTDCALPQSYRAWATLRADTTTESPTVATARSTRLYSSSFAVPASSLEQGLSRDERATVRVVRDAGPSVAYVTSVLLPSNRRNETDGGGVIDKKGERNALPFRGQPIGSGSGFVVDAAGYLCTNYHVIEAAYNLQEADRIQQQRAVEILGNLSSLSGARFDFDRCRSARSSGSTVQVYVRIDSQTRYRPCSIVDVVPELDVAVLKIDNEASDKESSSSYNSLVFGSSGSLLVGQQLIAIGNPFGLDNSVTTGVVSALNREIQVGVGRMDPRLFVMRMMPRSMTIRNCIQTDCAINPGNSGGPLLNRQGQVIGMNTAIVTTSGSNAGIGFAVSADLIQPEVQRIIRSDKQSMRPSAFLGVQIVKCRPAPNTSRVVLARNPWVAKVAPNSPAAKAGVVGLKVDEATGRVAYGDAIVAVGGNAVRDYAEIQAELDRCRVGEQIQLTLESKEGNRRVVYLALTDARSR